METAVDKINDQEEVVDVFSEKIEILEKKIQLILDHLGLTFKE